MAHTCMCAQAMCICVYHSPLPSPVSGDGLVTLATGQELAMLGQLWFKLLNTKRLGKEKELEGAKSQPPGSAHSCPTCTGACPISTPAKGCWKLGHRSKALYQAGLAVHPGEPTSEDSKQG